MALISKQKYDPVKIEKLADLVRLYYDKGQPFDYEIMVDGEKVVRRTNNPEMFHLFESFINGDTRGIEILFYIGSSNVHDKRIFTFGEEEKEKGLSGIEIDNRVQEQVEKHKREWEHTRLLNENRELREEIADLEKDVERLEKANQDLVNNQSPLRGVLGEIGSSFVESFIRRNPNILKSVPGGETLAGLLQGDGHAATDEHDDVEVNFKAKTGSPSSDEEQAAITFVNQLKSQFSKEEFEKVLQIIQTLSDDKTKIDLIINHIHIKQA